MFFGNRSSPTSLFVHGRDFNGWAFVFSLVEASDCLSLIFQTCTDKTCCHRPGTQQTCARQLDRTELASFPCGNTQERNEQRKKHDEIGKVRPEGLQFLYAHVPESFEVRDSMNRTPEEVTEKEQLAFAS